MTSNMFRVEGAPEPPDYEVQGSTLRTLIQVELVVLRQRAGVSEAGQSKLDRLDEAGVVVSIVDDNGRITYTFTNETRELEVITLDDQDQPIDQFTAQNNPDGLEALSALRLALFDLNDVAYRAGQAQPEADS